MANRVNQSNTTTAGELVDIPMPITVEEALEMGFKKSQIVYRFIGNRKYSCILIKGTQKQYDDWIREFDNERKAGDRERRCLMADGKGGYIMCPECNKCRECKKVGSLNFETNRPLSLDKLMDGEDEDDKTYDPPAKTNVSGDAVALTTLADLLDHLSTFNDKEYACIFQMLFDDQTVTEIAKELDIPWSTAKDQVKKVRELAKKYLNL